MKKIKNNSGVTLLETIIAIAIMTTILFISYKVINNINSVTINQKVISTEQQSVNLIKKYLNKDLERCKYVEVKSSIKSDEYEMKMPDNSVVKYEVIKNNNIYSINRLENNMNIEIVKNQKKDVNDNKPLRIEENNNIYRVYINSYGNKANDLYYFDIAPKTNKTQIINQSANNNMVFEITRKHTIEPKIGEISYSESASMKDFMNEILIDINFVENKVYIYEMEYGTDNSTKIGKYEDVFQGEFNEIKKFTVNSKNNSNFNPAKIEAYDKYGKIEFPYLKDEYIMIDLSPLNKIIDRIKIKINIVGSVSIELDN